MRLCAAYLHNCVHMRLRAAFAAYATIVEAVRTELVLSLHTPSGATYCYLAVEQLALPLPCCD